MCLDFIQENPHFSKTDILKEMSLDDISNMKKDSSANALTLVQLTGDRTGIWKSRKFYCSPRVGLTLKRPAPEKEYYIYKNYRFCTNPEIIKKNKAELHKALVDQGKQQEQLNNYRL